METYLALQRDRCGQLMNLRDNISKHSGPRTKEAQEILNITVSKLWTEFQLTDVEITKDLASTHPYVKEKYYDQVQAIVKKISEWSSLSTAGTPETNTEKSSSSNQNYSEQEKRILFQSTKLKSLARLINQIDLNDRSQVMAYYQLKLESLSASWASINQLHEEITNNSIMENINYQYLDKGSFDSAEEEYTRTAIFLRQILHNNVQSEGHSMAADNIKLPRLIIPDFSGNIDDWKPFQEMFIQFIHENQSLTELQKFQYLKSRITGEAAKLLQHFELSSPNYATAWNTLVFRYDNKRRLVQLKLQALVSQSTLPIATAHGLRSLHDTTKECLHSLTNMGVDTSSWGPLIEYIILQKLDKQSHQLYEQSINEHTKVQDLSSVLKFLDTRFKTFEVLDCTGKNNITT